MYSNSILLEVPVIKVMNIHPLILKPTLLNAKNQDLIGAQIMWLEYITVYGSGFGAFLSCLILEFAAI